MHIAWEQFTPFSALGGGLLIGLASIILMAGIGRIAGVTGILAGVMIGLIGAKKIRMVMAPSVCAWPCDLSFFIPNFWRASRHRHRHRLACYFGRGTHRWIRNSTRLWLY